MLRYRADARTLAFVAFYYALLATEWRWAHGWFVVPLVIATCMISWICAVVTHNTLHSPVFKNRTANRVFQIALTCAYGFPVSEYVPGRDTSPVMKARLLRISITVTVTCGLFRKPFSFSATRS